MFKSISTYHEHRLGLWQVLPLVNLDVSLVRDNIMQVLIWIYFSFLKWCRKKRKKTTPWNTPAGPDMWLCFHWFLSQPDDRGAAVWGSDFAAALWTLGPHLTQPICKSSSQCLWYFAKCRAKGTGETILPWSCPLNVGLVATFNPGWGNRKQEIFVKHEWMWSLTVCSSSCWDSLTFKKK